MRLGQLARKLAIRPVDIIEFLREKGIETAEDANTRLEDIHVAMLMQKFGTPETLPLEKAQVEESSAPEPATQEAPVTEMISEKPDDQPIELIKAPKIELSGLKVLGKIELPEPKKIVAPEVQPGENEHREQRQDSRRQQYPRRNNYQSSGKNPVVLQREREAKAAEQRRKEREDAEKEKKAMHYLKKVKAPPPTRRVRLIDEPVEEFSQESLVPPPKSMWGKFMRWLNT